MSLYDEIINGTYKNGVTKINYKKKEDEDDYNSFNNLYDSIKNGTDYSVNNINTKIGNEIPDMSNNKLYKSIIDGTFDKEYSKSKNTNNNITNADTFNKYGLGNIDLTNRQAVKNQDGSISTVRSISFKDNDGKEVLIPTVVNGKIVSDKEAIEHYYTTGEYLGKFNSIEEANVYAEQLHKYQKNLYSNQEEASFWNKAGWIGKKTGAGIAGGTVGIGQAVLTDVANNIQQGKEKGIEGIKEDLKGTDKIQKERNELVKDSFDTTVKVSQIMNDKNTSKVEKVFNLFMYGIGQVMNKIGNAREKSAGGKIINAPVQALGSLLPESTSQDLMNINQNISKPIEEMNQRLAEEGQNYGIATQWIGNAMQSVGNMTPSIAATLITKNPNIGLGIMGVSAKGQSTEEALKKGSSLNEAVKIGDEKGMIEIGTEMLTGGVNIFGKGALDDILQKGIVDKVKNNVAKFFVQQGVNVLGETLEETISDIVDTAIDKGTVNPNATYSLKDWTNTAIETTLSTLVLNLITGGMVNDVRNIKNNGTELKTVIDAGETKPLFVTKTAPDGNISFVESTQGIPIENSNNDLNINPAIVYNNKTDTYNVIDSNTGLLLDNSPYPSILSAKMGFNEKTTNISEAQVKNINDSVVKTELALIQKTNEIIAELEENEKTNRYNNINIENNINNQQNIPTQINQDNAESNFYNEKTNYAVSNLNEIKNEFKAKEQYTLDEVDETWAKIEEDTYDLTDNDDYQLWLEKTPDNKIKATLYDTTTDNDMASEINSITIEPNKDGMFTAESINNAVEQLARIPDENAPIQGQIDIEGNQVQSVANNNQNMYNDNKKGDDVDGKRKRQIRNGNNEEDLEGNRKRENTRRKEENGRNNENSKREISRGLSNYVEQKKERLGGDFKAEIVKESDITERERIVSKGFKDVTGLDDIFYSTNKSTTESAFYSANEIYQKHRLLVTKKILNHAPYHEFGHWLKDNMPKQWNKLHKIMDKTITKEQIENYISVLNDKEYYNKMKPKQKKEAVINEIISDYFGNWANDISNLKPLLDQGIVSQEYAELVADITKEEKVVGYEIFGTLNQEKQMNDTITEIMTDIVKENNTNNNVNIKYSNRDDTTNNDVVLLKSELFKGKKVRDWNKLVKSYIYNELADTSYKLENRDKKIYIAKKNDRMVKEGTKNSHRVIDKLANAQKTNNIRNLCIANIAEVIKSSKYDSENQEHSHQWLDEKGWEFRKVYIQDEKGNLYEATLNIAKGKDRDILYDINKIKKVDHSNVPSKKRLAKISTSNNNIAQKNKNVKLDFPKNVKDIKNLNQFLREAVEEETDKYWKESLKDALSANDTEYWFRRESPLQWKRGIVQQYLNYKNGIEYSDRTDITEDSEGNKLSKGQQEYFKNTKAVDNNGNLKVVYHGTGEGTFNIFKGGSFGANYYTDNIWSARSYQVGTSTANKIYEGYVNIENPLIIDVENRNWSEIWRDSIIDEDVLKAIDDDFKNKYETYSTTDIVIAAKATNKFDGVIFNNIYDNSNNNKKEISSVYVTFNSNQFKNIDNKNPTSDPDIRYSDRYDIDENEDYGFYSQLEKVIEEKMPNTTNAQQLKGILDKAGIKQDEMKWIGLDDYLKAHSLEKLSKEKVMEYIKANQIYIETVRKGDSKLRELTEPIKNDIEDLKVTIKRVLDRYSIDYEEDDARPYKRNGTRSITVGDYMPEGLEQLVDLDGLTSSKGKDGKIHYEMPVGNTENGVSAYRYFTDEEFKEDMKNLSDMYDRLFDQENKLSEIESSNADDFPELEMPKYKQYSLEGGTNYQERLYTVPGIKKVGSDKYEVINNAVSNVSEYRSPHWNEKNVLAHTRTQDFEDINGNKVLFIDEIQSDLHQEGRKNGYVDEETLKKKQELNNRINDIKDTKMNLEENLYNINQKMKKDILTDLANKQTEIIKRRKAKELNDKLTRDEQYALVDFQDKMNQIYSTVIEKHNIFNVNNQQNMIDLLRSYEEYHLLDSIKDKFKDNMKELEDYIIDTYKLEYLYDRYTDIEKGWSTIREDEMQSVLTNKEYKERKKMIKQNQDLYLELEKLEDEYKDIQEGIADVFPFKKNWHEFALRRIINDAVSQGYDEVAWTTGRQQRERYNLSKAIDYIEYQRFYDHPNDVDKGKVGEVEISAYKDGNNVFDRQIRAEDLADYIGKDLAMRILNAKEGKGTISNLDEEIRENGNSGMYLFYDQEIPSYLNKYLKKWNSKVEPIVIKDIDGKDESVQPGFKITKEMRESIKQNGQPLFSDRADIEDETKTPKREYTEEEKEYIENQRRERLEVAKMIKERSFLNNILQSNVDKDFKKILRNNKDKFNYEPISNETTMKEASERVDKYKDLEMAKNEFLQNELQTATDTAVGELLIRKALANGNYQEANQITAALAEKLTTAGQTVQAAAMFKRMTPEGMLMFAQRKINQINKELSKEYGIDKLLKKKEIKQLELTEEKVNFINEMMKQMQDWENKKKDVTDGKTMEIIEREQDIILAKVMAKIGEGIPVSKMDKIAAWRNISLLLNTKTINRNLVSNALFSSLENIVDMLGVPIDKAISLMTGERSLLMPNLKTQFKGLKKGLDYAIFDTKEGISTSLGGNKYEIKPSKTFENKLLNKLETLTYFGVEGLDRPFMQSKYDSALEMLMKLDGLEYGKDIPTEEMKQEALDMAKYTTFKDKNVISDFLSKTKNTLNMGKSVGLADVIGLTYTNIPGNLTKKAIDYSPAGLYNIIKSYKNLKAKQISGESLRQAQREFVQSTARVLIGTGIMTASIRAVLAGILTASGDDEDDKVKSLTDQENYAINVSAFLRWLTGRDTAKQNGDLYVTYSNYEPLSSIIAAAAEMVGSAKKGDNLGTIAYKGLTTWINTIAELSTLSNFSSLFEYGDLGGTLTRSIAQFPASFIPTTSKQIAQLFEQNSKSSYSDNYFTKNFINPILQRIPGLSSTLQSNYDTMGNEEENYNGSEGLSRLFNVFLNTSFTSTVNMDNVEQELYDLYLSTGNTDHLPLQVKNNFIYKGQKITLTAEEKAKYQETLGKRTAEEFKKVMATDEYKNMTDEDKVKKLKNIISDINTDVKGEVVLEPRGIAYDTTFTPSGSSLSKGGYSLNLTEDMQKEYEQIAADYYNKYAKQGLYSEDKLKELKSKAKDYAKNELFKTYKDKIHKTK